MIDHPDRLRRLQDRLPELGVDALLITDLINVRYLTGFSGSNGQCLVDPNRVVFLTDPRYEARAGSIVSGADIVLYRTRLSERLGELVDGVELGFEARSMTVAERTDLEKALRREMSPTRDVVEGLRRVKDEHEESLIREAVRIADETFESIIEWIRPGMTEAEVALEIEVRMRRSGAEAVSFEPIVGSGPQSAHIHHTPNDRILQEGEILLLDFGARWEGYCSDLTRTVCLGPSTDRQQEVYSVVLASQEAAIRVVAPGISGVEADAAARAVIDEAGYGETFGHGTGHGVGLDIHEAPRLHFSSDDTLLEREVVTVEPGVYLTEDFGIRVEDCVLVTADGAEVLGKAPKQQLIEVGRNR